jgi:Zn-dependent membrane protease YugP
VNREKISMDILLKSFRYFDILLYLYISFSLVVLTLNILFRYYIKNINITSNLTASVLCQELLKRNNVLNVNVEEMENSLISNDAYYHPFEKAIYLKKDFIDNKTMLSLYLALHEAGHAIQHKYSKVFTLQNITITLAVTL